jgi:hypothetical protein
MQGLIRAMALSEVYLLALECANCGTKGAAEYEGNDTLPHHSGQLRRELRSVRGEFEVGPGRNPSIYCVRCNARVA